jgi:hypothetical protein
LLPTPSTEDPITGRQASESEAAGRPFSGSLPMPTDDEASFRPWCAEAAVSWPAGARTSRTKSRPTSLLLASATSHTGDRLGHPFRAVRRKFVRANDCFRVPEDNARRSPGRPQAARHEPEPWVAASTAGTSSSSPVTSASASAPTTKPSHTS